MMKCLKPFQKPVQTTFVMLVFPVYIQHLLTLPSKRKFMKYKICLLLIGVFFSITNLYSQSTYFIKYKNTVSLQDIDKKVLQQKISPAGKDLQIEHEIKSVNYLAKGLGRENELLSRIVKVSFDKSVSATSIYELQSLDENIEYV